MARIAGIDVGTQRSHVVVIDLLDRPKIAAVYEINTSDPRNIDVSHLREIEGCDVVYIERPSPRYFGRKNAAVLLKVAARAGDIFARIVENFSAVRCVFVDFDEWAEYITPKTTSREEIDNFFVEIFEKRLHNEHIRDAAVMALKMYRRHGS